MIFKDDALQTLKLSLILFLDALNLPRVPMGEMVNLKKGGLQILVERRVGQNWPPAIHAIRVLLLWSGTTKILSRGPKGLFQLGAVHKLCHLV